MNKKKEDKKLTKDQAEKKILNLKKDLFNIRFKKVNNQITNPCLLYTSPSPRDAHESRMPSSA